jgi:hypothetical protein
MQASAAPNIGAASWVKGHGLPMMAARSFARLPMNAKLLQQDWPLSWRFVEFKVNDRASPSRLALIFGNTSTF